MRKKRMNRILILSILIIAISIGFAYISATLQINGNAAIGVHEWKIYWDHVANEKGVTATTSPQISDDTIGTAPNTKTVADAIVTWDVLLKEPGDYYEFTVDAVNEGTIDGMITNITTTASPNLPAYVKYTVTYADGKPIRKYQKLLKAVNDTPSTETYKIRVEYDRDAVEISDVNEMASGGESYSFSFAVTYETANKYGYDRKYSNLVFSDKFGSSMNPAFVGLPAVSQYGDVISASTDDYTTLVDGNNQQKLVFPGIIVGSDDIIEHGYACGLIDGELFCFEGPSTPENYDVAKTVWPTIFGDFDVDTVTGCQVLNDDTQIKCYIEEGNTNAYLQMWKNDAPLYFQVGPGRYSQVYPGGPPGARGYAMLTYQ